MKTGVPIKDLAEKIIKLKDAKKDYGISTSALRMDDTGMLTFNVKDSGSLALKPTRLCLTQIGNRVGIPSKYLDRMALEAPGLLADNILNHLARGGNATLWGLVNAITRTAEDVASYDRAIELERYGGMALELPASTFAKN